MAEKFKPIEVGHWRMAYHYAVIGNPTNFYVWARHTQNDAGSVSEHIVGDINLYHTLKQTLLQNGKYSFVRMVKRILKTNPKR